MNESQKLSKDLDILAAMARGMSSYLLSKTMFQTLQPNMPQLTLGGYLLRQHRLQALQDELLDASEQATLSQAIRQFEQALQGKQSHFAQKAGRELDSRLRQWGEYLREVEDDPRGNRAFYSAQVEIRAMIAALTESLPAITAAQASKCKALDSQLKQRWVSGDFVWPAEWQAAYPKDIYWWLYGQTDIN